MSDIYKVWQEDGITRVKLREKPSFQQAADMLSYMTENFPDKPRLYDLTDIKFDFTQEELLKFSEFGKQQANAPEKLAIIAADDLSYGEMRQYSVYREEKDKMAIRIFRSLDTALDWLKS